jgi:hypothetical protein
VAGVAARRRSSVAALVRARSRRATASACCSTSTPAGCASTATGSEGREGDGAACCGGAGGGAGAADERWDAPRCSGARAEKCAWRAGDVDDSNLRPAAPAEDWRGGRRPLRLARHTCRARRAGRALRELYAALLPAAACCCLLLPAPWGGHRPPPREEELAAAAICIMYIENISFYPAAALLPCVRRFS